MIDSTAIAGLRAYTMDTLPEVHPHMISWQEIVNYCEAVVFLSTCMARAMCTEMGM